MTISGYKGPTQPIAPTHHFELSLDATSTMMSRAPTVVAPPPILRPDWEALVRLASTRSKPLNLDTCSASTSLHWFCDAIDKSMPAWF
jgi:hypothetical protein